MDNFPPKTNYQREVQAVLEFLVSAIGKQDAVYMSAPITSGKRLIEFHKRNDVQSNSTHNRNLENVFTQIVEYNRTHAKLISQKFRERIKSVIIDPTLVADIDGWTQDDYRFLWAKIIERYTNVVVYVDDWNYSNGCAYEFLVAKQSNIKTLNEMFNPLSIDEGIVLIQRAIEDLEQCHLPTKFLQSVLSELDKINNLI